MKITSYDLLLEIDFETLEIIGHETITFTEPENYLVLDASGLKIDSVSNSTDLRLPFSQDREAKKLVIRDVTKIESDARGERKIKISYNGKVAEESLHGIYKSRYDGGYLIATDFEPNGARLLFPCVDDPDFKAVFNLEVTTQKDLVVTSNSREEESVAVDEQRIKHVFDSTPRMSAYLFYLGIGKFESSNLIDDGVEFRALAKPGYAIKGVYAMEHAAKFLKLYEEYYSIPYPLSKLDLIALPEYSAGAMENWGAITFREVAILVDENSSFSNKRGVAEVVGHEVAHQWFGDLVTMKWWNDLWLNESFATFMESKMTDTIYPEWNVWSDFLHEMSGAMQGDSLHGTHPIDVDVKAPEEISQIFDEISYGKGASILRMIETWLGQDAFRDGVRKYLAEFIYSNASGEDLWRKLEEASGMPVSDVMEAWIKKPGYPVLKVSIDDGKLQLKQERFFLKKTNQERDIWPIPVVAWLNGRQTSLLLREESATITLEGPVKEIKLNLGQSGFYRVLYDQTGYSIIRSRFSELAPFDRWGVISDLFAFLIAGRIDLELYFDFTSRAQDDTDYLMVETIAGHLQFLRQLAPENSMVREIYLDYYRKQMKRLGLEPKSGERDTDKILRGSIAAGLALEDRDFDEILAGRFAEYDRQVPDIRTAVAIAFSRKNRESGYAALISTMKKMSNEADVIKIYSALTSFYEPDLVRRSLDFCISGEVSRADSVYAIISAAQNPYARAVTWQWVKDNLEALRRLFSGTSTVSSLLQEVISRAGIGREKEIKDYFSKIKIVEADKGIAKGIELLDVYSDLAERLSQSKND